MSSILAALLGTRTLSHYAASPSSPALSAGVGLNFANSFSTDLHQTWRSLSQAAITMESSKSMQGDRLQPQSSVLPVEDAQSTGHSDGTTSPGTPGGADALPSTRPAPARWRRLKLPEVPAAVLRDLRAPTQPYQLTPNLSQRPTGSPAQYTPWTPTRVLQRRKHITKRMGFLMQILEREQMERVRRARPLPDFRAGDILEVRMMLPEAERKVTIYRGVCIARYHKGIRSTFKIYNVYPECGGVVQHIPLYMPDLLGVKVVGRIPASQERLFYLLDRETSDYTFQTGVSAAN